MSAFEADRFNRSRTSPRRTRIHGYGGRAFFKDCNKPRWRVPRREHGRGRPCLRRSGRWLAAAGAEEGLQHLGAAAGENAGLDCYLVIHGWVVDNLNRGADGAGFGVVGAVDQASDAGVDHGSGAHGAGLDGDEELAVAQAMVAEGGAGLAQGDDFGVGGGVAVADGAVAGAGENLTFVYEHSADRDFAGFGCGTRFCESFLYELDVSFYRAGGHI